MNNNLTIADGRTEFTINGDESRKIRINLNDNSLPNKIRKAQKKIEELSVKAKDLSESENVGLDDYYDMVDEAESEIRKLIDRAFDYRISDTVFGSISPLAIVDTEEGKTYIEAFLEAILPFIEDAINKQNEYYSKMQKRVAKYTNKYPKDNTAYETPDTDTSEDT